MSKPKVIVVMPAYNAEKTLERTIKDIPPGSVDEVILVDDCSKDGTVDLARKLGLTTVAEGVEAVEDWQMLAELGCDIAQGYLIARPVPGSELQAAIARWRRPAH